MSLPSIARFHLMSRLALALGIGAGCSQEAPTSLGLPIQAAPGGGAPIQVDSTDPNNAPQGTTLDVRVLGQNFENGAKVDFLLNGANAAGINTNSSRFVNATEVVANVTIAPDAAIDLYDVKVTVAGKKPGVGIEKFQVLQQGPPGQWDPPPLVITFGQGANGSNALRGDDVANSSYPEPGHISGNGNLMFWLGDENPRLVRVTTTAFNAATRDRIFTNTHTNPGGDDSFGLLGMAEGSTGTAVLEAELDANGVVRYGKDCGEAAGPGVNPTHPNRVVTTRSADGRTWTITGTSGLHCRQLRKGKPMVQVGTAGPFSMTMVWPQ